MALNTDFKIVDHADNASKYDITFPDNWTPLNENQAQKIQIQDLESSYDVDVFMNSGVRGGDIVLQGKTLPADMDQYKLRCMLADRRIKKLYLGDEYFYYVRGYDPRLVRAVEIPQLARYIAAFRIVDPFQYKELDATPVWNVNITAPVSNEVFLPQTGTLGGYWNVKPIFWFSVTGAATITTITDPKGRVLSVTPSATGTWIVMPWFNHDVENFISNGPGIAFKRESALTISQLWALDAKIEGASKDFDVADYAKRTSVTFDIASGYPPRTYNIYPNAEIGAKTTFTLALGANTSYVGMQWMERR